MPVSYTHLVLPYIDYCNVVLTVLNKKQVKSLQSILNVGARFIFRLSRYEHVTPFLSRLLLACCWL